MKNSRPIQASASALEQAGSTPQTFHSGAINLREIPGTAIVGLHAFPDFDAGDLVLPMETGQCSTSNANVLCIRPLEWLIISETIKADTLLRQVSKAVSSTQGSALDRSDGLAVFRLSGAGAPWLLNKLSCLDFQSAGDSGPHCARTRMGQGAVIVHYHGNSSGQFVFDLIFDRSMALYYWDLITASAPHADELNTVHGANA